MPAAVLGPVDMPPCILHRPFFIAAARQGVPARVLAPASRRVVPIAGRTAMLMGAAVARLAEGCGVPVGLAGHSYGGGGASRG